MFDLQIDTPYSKTHFSTSHNWTLSPCGMRDKAASNDTDDRQGSKAPSYPLQIALIPRVDSISFYSGSLINDNRRQEYERYQCSQTFYEGQSLATVPEVCKQHHLDSIGFLVYGQAFCEWLVLCSVSSGRDSLPSLCF